MNILMDLYHGGKDYINDFPDHKLKDMVKDLKKSLNSPNLTDAQKEDLAIRIAAMERNSKSARKKADLINLALSIVEYTSSFLGPVGSGFTSLVTNKPRRNNELNRTMRIRKARKAGGRRISSSRGSEKFYTKNNAPDKASVKDTVSGGILDSVSDAATTIAGEMASRSWEMLRSFIKV